MPNAPICKNMQYQQKILGLGIVALTIALIGNNYLTISDRAHAAKLNQSIPTNILTYSSAINFDVPNTADSKRFQAIMLNAIDRQLSNKTIGNIMQAIGYQFLGTPYKAGLLDRSPNEKLIISFQGFDCVLFVETVFALAQGIARQDYNYPNFSDRLRQLRYRNGEINGYCSRLHYFSDWILDNEKKGKITNITANLGGIPLNKNFNFMTTHKSSYPQLSKNTNYQCILNVETKLNNLKIHYIPNQRIYTVYNQLQAGDIVAIATDIQGLDVTHTGLVYRMPDGNIGFIHASPNGSVRISSDLQNFVEKVNNSVGIIVARPQQSSR